MLPRYYFQDAVDVELISKQFACACSRQMTQCFWVVRGCLHVYIPGTSSQSKYRSHTKANNIATPVGKGEAVEVNQKQLRGWSIVLIKDIGEKIKNCVFRSNSMEHGGVIWSNLDFFFVNICLLSLLLSCERSLLPMGFKTAHLTVTVLQYIVSTRCHELIFSFDCHFVVMLWSS